MPYLCIGRSPPLGKKRHLIQKKGRPFRLKPAGSHRQRPIEIPLAQRHAMPPVRSTTQLPNIMAKRHIHKLEEFTHSNVLLAFDFDGTLAPIVQDPARARMRPQTRRLLGAVARRYPCVVISGRARHDVLKRVGSVPVWQVSGNHGLEPWAQNAAYPTQVQRLGPSSQARSGLASGRRRRRQDLFGDRALSPGTAQATGPGGDQRLRRGACTTRGCSAGRMPSA